MHNQFTSSFDNRFLSILIPMLFIFLAIFLIVLILIYVATSLATSRIARDKGLPVWMGWVPVLSTYILFKSANISKWFILCYLYLVISIAGIFTDVPAVLSLLSNVLILIIAIVSYVALYRLGKEYNMPMVLFWFNVFFVTCSVAYIIILGGKAKENYIKSLESASNADALE